MKHVTPGLRHLCWLPVSFWVQFKVIILISKALYGLGPSYLINCLFPWAWQLISARVLPLTVPCSETEEWKAGEWVCMQEVCTPGCKTCITDTFWHFSGEHTHIYTPVTWVFHTGGYTSCIYVQLRKCVYTHTNTHIGVKISNWQSNLFKNQFLKYFQHLMNFLFEKMVNLCYIPYAIHFIPMTYSLYNWKAVPPYKNIYC